MRVKKQKRHRKIVRFYSTCFGFREPYKILCDGTFIHHLLIHDLTPADDSLSHLLGARVLLFTSRCIISELRSLGVSHSEALEAASQILTARCDHEKRVSAEACLESIIGETNSEHFFVATEDFEIRKKFQEVPGVPLIYGVRNSLLLEQPSLIQKKFVKSIEERRLHVNELEYIKPYKRELRDRLDTGEVDSATAEDKHAERSRSTSKRTPIVDKARFKKKRAKGPNPLSCKKKKQKECNIVTNNQVQSAKNLGKLG